MDSSQYVDVILGENDNAENISDTIDYKAAFAVSRCNVWNEKIKKWDTTDCKASGLIKLIQVDQGWGNVLNSWNL